MQFETKKEDILKTLQIVQNAISIKNTLPILSNLLMEVVGNNLTITATDLDMGISSTTQIKPQNEGTITIPAKKIIDIIKELPEEAPISIFLKKNNIMSIESNKAHFKIVGLPKEEFPQVPEFPDKDFIKIPQKLLKEMILLTHFAVSRDETRYVLNGILFEIKGNRLKLVATDGRRLAIIEKELPDKTNKDRKSIIPTKACNELLKMLDEEGEIKIKFSEKQVFFDLDRTKLISKLVEGEFPNYEQVIPKEAKDKIKVDRTGFLSATRRASLFTNPDSLAVKLDISKNKIVISKSEPYLGEVREELDTAYNGRNISVGFNPNYLIDLLKNLDQDKVELEIEDLDKPGVIRIGNEYIYIVLPMQIV